MHVSAMFVSVLKDHLLRIGVPSAKLSEEMASSVNILSRDYGATVWETFMAGYSGRDTELLSRASNLTLSLDQQLMADPAMAEDLTKWVNVTTTTAPAITTTTAASAAMSGATTAASLVSGDHDLTCTQHEFFMMALPWIRIIFGLLMVVENTLSLYALWHVKRMQTAVHRFISSLAVADLLMGVWNCYRYSAEILVGSDTVTVECMLRFVVNTYLNFAAIMSVCALCLDRCLAVHFPYRYMELVTKPRVRMMLGAVWVLPVAFVLTAYVDTDAPCRYCSFVDIASQRTYIVLTVLRCVLISVIIVCELLIFRAARGQIVKIYPSVFVSAKSSSRLTRMNAKAAVTTLAVVLPFLLLYLPVVLVQGNLAAHPEMADACQGQLLAFVWLFASAHGLLTPLVFCWRFTEVRHSLLRLLACCSRRSCRLHSPFSSPSPSPSHSCCPPPTPGATPHLSAAPPSRPDSPPIPIPAAPPVSVFHVRTDESAASVV